MLGVPELLEPIPKHFVITKTLRAKCNAVINYAGATVQRKQNIYIQFRYSEINVLTFGNLVMDVDLHDLATGVNDHVHVESL